MARRLARRLRDALGDDRPRPLSPRARWLWLLVVAVLMALRAPLLVLEPRVFAEEASVYLSYAASHEVLPSLLLVPTTGAPAGYLNLAANLAAVISARLVPLELTPVVGTAIAFLLQLLPIAIVLWGRSVLWSTPPRRLLCCLVLLLAPAVTPFVWLKVITAHVFCGVATFLLLFESLDGLSPRRRWAYRSILLFCGATGGFATMLVPAFAVRAWIDRRREARVHLGLLGAMAVLQLTAYLATLLREPLAPNRLVPRGLWTRCAAVFHQQILQPVLGSAVADRIEATQWLGGGASLLATVGVLAWLASARGDRRLLLFPVSLLALQLSTTVLALGPPSGRYAVVPGLAFVLALLAGAFESQGSRLRRATCVALLGLSLASGVASYRADPEFEYPDGGTFSFFAHRPGRPIWSQEVAAWRRDRSWRLGAWPYNDRRAWRTSLTTRQELARLRGVFPVADDLHLVLPPWSSRDVRVPLPALPTDFRIVVRGRAAGGSHAAELEIELLGDDGLTIARTLLGYAGGGPFHLALPRAALLPDEAPEPGALESLLDASRLPAPPIPEVQHLLLRATTVAEGAALEVERIEIVPSVEGLLDGILPTQALPSTLHLAAARRPRGQESTALLALESLRDDGDLLYRDADQARARRRWRRGPEGLELRRRRGAPPAYAAGLPFLVLAAPAYFAAGADGVVALDLLLFLGVAALALAHWRAAGSTGILFAAGSSLLAAGVGFVFLPQSTVLQAFCLFVPALGWVRGRWVRAGWSELALYGVLLGAAATLEPLWALLLVAAGLASWAAGEPRRALLPAFVGLAVLALCALLPAAWGGGWTFDPVAARWDWHATWEIYGSRRGLLLGYPFASYAVVEVVRGGGDRRRLGLAAGVVLLSGAIALGLAGDPAASGPLGSPQLAALAPLFVLLPLRLSPRWALALPFGVGLLCALGVASLAWTP